MLPPFELSTCDYMLSFVTAKVFSQGRSMLPCLEQQLAFLAEKSYVAHRVIASALANETHLQLAD